MAFVFWLPALPPFRLDLTAWAVRRRPENKIDVWDGTVYSRVLAIGSKAVKVCVVQVASASSRLRVTVAGIEANASIKGEIVSALDKLLGTSIDLRAFYSFAGRDARLSRLCQRFRGLKPPRFPTIFETLVNGIACQQLSLTVGITLLNRLAEAHGLTLGEPGQRQYAFPTPEQVATASGSELRQLGFSTNKGRALIELSSAMAAGQLNVERLAHSNDRETVSRLMDIRGVGRWTAEYVLLRGFGRTHVFPGDDIGARNNLARWLKLRAPLDYEGVARKLTKWKPYAGLIYFHLLMDSLEGTGYLQS